MQVSGLLRVWNFNVAEPRYKRANTRGDIVPTFLVDGSVIEVFGFLWLLYLTFCEVFVLIHASKAHMSTLLN